MTRRERYYFTANKVKNIEFVLVLDGKETKRGKGIKMLDYCLDFALYDFDHKPICDYDEAFIVADGNIMWYSNDDPITVTMFYDTPDEEFYKPIEKILAEDSYGEYKPENN